MIETLHLNAEALALPDGEDSVRVVGARLADLRHQQGWSIDDIAARLKVSAAKLSALEAGDFGRLPDITFAIGIVRNYAKLLGVDPAPLADMARRASEPVVRKLTLPPPCGADLRRSRVAVPRRTRARRRLWAWSLSAMALIAAALALYQHGNWDPAWMVRFKMLPPGQTIWHAGAVANATVAEMDKRLVGKSAARPSAGADSLSPKHAGGGSLQGLQQIPPQLPSATAAALANSSAVVASQLAAASDRGTELIFKVSQDNWINVLENSGKRVFSGIVKAGTEQRVQGVAPFNIIVGNQKGIDAIEIDGQAVDPSKYTIARGDVAHFSLP